VLLRYLLDTDVVSNLIREPKGVASIRLARKGADAVCTSVIVAGELRFGARKSGSMQLASKIEAILGAIPILPLDAPVDRHYGDIRDVLRFDGLPIGPNDLWIAAHARSRDLTIVTGNDREFVRVPGLKVENWLRTQA
jgi:tRNA(fMet)-specific endonuclease VapC